MRTLFSLPLTFLTAGALALSIAACEDFLGESEAPIQALPTQYVLPGDQVFPEGIAFDEGEDVFYVSSTTDGTIFFQTDLGSDTLEVFSEGGADDRTTAIGLAVQEDRLFVAGGGTGRAYTYDTDDGDILTRFTTPEPPQDAGTFINDVAVTPDGDAYFTDSFRPILFRATPTDAETAMLETWLDLTGTLIQYQDGFNLNGIVSTPDGDYLIVVQSNTGGLFRIDVDTKEVQSIDLEGETLTNGDGLLLDGQTLYVVRNQQEAIVPVTLSTDFLSGTLGTPITSERLRYPTTIAQVLPNFLLAVNSQFDERNGGAPSLPFTVARVRIP